MSSAIEKNKRVGIVFFIYINSKKNYKKIIKAQLNDLILSGVLTVADLHLVINISDDVNCKDDLNLLFSTFNISITSILYTEENYFEYEGISKLYELALSNKYDYLSYFHTKGMSYKKHLFFKRSPREIVLTYLNFYNYKNTIQLFDSNSDINKISPFPSLDDDSKKQGQWSWFNFYWIRACFVKSIEKPQKTLDRFYYEGWTKHLMNQQSSNNDNYSLYYKKIIGLKQEDVSVKLRNLAKLYKYLFPFSRLYLLVQYNLHK